MRQFLGKNGKTIWFVFWFGSAPAVYSSIIISLVFSNVLYGFTFGVHTHIAILIASFGIVMFLHSLVTFWMTRRTHKFPTTGFFKIFRHPLLVGYCLFLFGCTLLSPSWFAIAILFAILVPSMFVRGKVYESVMIKQYQEVYIKFLKTVLFPF